VFEQSCERGGLPLRDFEHKRQGTANVFCGVQPKARQHFTKANSELLLAGAHRLPRGNRGQLFPRLTPTSGHGQSEFAQRKALVERFGERIGGLLGERFTVHYTPKHGSWLNQAEIEISLFSRQCLDRRRIPLLGELQQEAWQGTGI
jgi:hypothetical protein